MFGWLFPARCPVSPNEKAWVEHRTRWLAQEFGLERMLRARVILPTPEFFPDPYQATESDGRRLFERVCGYLGMQPGSVPLEFYAGDQPLPGMEGRWQDAAGLYESTGWAVRVSASTSLLEDPLALIATFAHELCHVLLKGRGRVAAEDEDEEHLTDLLTVVLGFGVFTANSRIRTQTTTQHWSIRRLGYLSQPVTGYALAFFAWVRAEASPSWAGELTADVCEPFQTGLRFLQKTLDSLWEPNSRTFRATADDELAGLGGRCDSASAPGRVTLDDELPPGFGNIR
jgi:hypothetical protein